MSLLSSIPIIGKIFTIVEKVVPDKDLAAKIKGELASADFSMIEKEIDVQAQALAAELSGSAIQRSWRPHLMYLIMFFLFYLIVIVPGFGLFGVNIPVKAALDSVPNQMWILLTVGVGGYTALRSVEKAVASWTKRK